MFQPGEALRYIHKTWQGRQIYFFANLTGKTANTTVDLRGKHRLEKWDPHTGKMDHIESEQVLQAGTAFTRVHVALAPQKSVFLISGAEKTGTM
jgi:hypothetical protein